MRRNRPTVGVSCGVSGEDFAVRRAYWQALGAIGLGGLILPPQIADKDDVCALMSGLSGLLLTGGGDPHPCLWGEEPRPSLGAVDAVRDEWELALLEAALSQDMPVLGICRGMQMLNVYFGGTLWQDLADYDGGGVRILHNQTAAPNTAWHSVSLQEQMSRLLGRQEMWVNSFHHQGVRRLGEGIVPWAWAADGLVEGISVGGLPFAVGVQWHAEHLRGQEPLWRAYAAACVEYEQRQSKKRDICE